MKTTEPKKETLRASHTPGPWFHIPRNRDGHVDVITDREGNRSRAFISVGSPECERPILDYPHDNVQSANARLVAAAPELLEVCKEMLRLHEAMGNDLPTTRSARSVIAKAEGRSE